YLAHLVELGDRPAVERGDHESRARLVLEQPLGFEAADRVPHRRAAHIELFRDGHFHDAITGFQHAAPERVPELLIGVAATRAAAAGLGAVAARFFSVRTHTIHFHVRYYTVFSCI